MKNIPIPQLLFLISFLILSIVEYREFAHRDRPLAEPLLVEPNYGVGSSNDMLFTTSR